MRIALIVPGGVDRGGEYRVIPAILWLLERLARRHDVEVVVPNQEPETGTWELLGARVHNIGAERWRGRAVLKVRQLHRENAFDVIHALWARGSGEVGLAASVICRTPLLVHVMGGELVWLPDVDFGSRRASVRALVRLVLRRANVVTVVSETMHRLATEAGASPERVPWGVDTSRWVPREPQPRDETRPARLVHVGSLTPVKDHGTLLRAVSQLIEGGVSVHVDLVGFDALEGAVQSVVSELGLEAHVTVHGFLTQAETMPVVSAADIMVVTSRHEAGPVAMLEAAAVGVPTVGTAVGYVSDWAPERAVEVPIADPVALADAIRSLLEDEPRRRAIAQRAQQTALDKDADWTAARYEQLYEQVIARAR